MGVSGDVDECVTDYQVDCGAVRNSIGMFCFF